MQTTQTELELDTPAIQRGQRVFRALNHPLRQQIIQYIHKHQRIAVTQIYKNLRLEQSVASAHLAILRREKIVQTAREGKKIHYSVNYDRLREVHAISQQLVH